MRGIITGNILLLKYQKQVIAVALKGEDACMLLPIALRKSWIYQVLPFIVTRDTSPIGNKVSDQKFFWSADMNFIPDWKSEIVYQRGSADKSVREFMLLRRN